VNELQTAGEEAAQLFFAITGAHRPRSAKRGDAVVYVSGFAHYVEIKAVGSNQINQVRPVRFIPLALWDRNTRVWHVVPGNRVVTAAARKFRGQHTESPFECCSLRLDKLSAYRVEDDLLPAAIRQAIAEDVGRQDLHDLMRNLVRDTHMLTERYRISVLSAGGINGQIGLFETIQPSGIETGSEET
jgi:hypothetical protein